MQREVSGAGQSPFRAPCQAALEAARMCARTEVPETDSLQSICMADRARITCGAGVICCVHDQPSATNIC